jgi:hypothetical protein
MQKHCLLSFVSGSLFSNRDWLQQLERGWQLLQQLERGWRQAFLEAPEVLGGQRIEAMATWANYLNKDGLEKECNAQYLF